MSAALAVAAALMLQQGGVEHEPPSLPYIRPRPDTVWFLGSPSYEDSTSVAYGWLRAEERWARLGRVAFRPEPRLPGEAAGAVRVASGIELVRVSGGEGRRTAVYGLRFAEEGHTYPIEPEPSMEVRRRHLEGVQIGLDPLTEEEIRAYPVVSAIGAWTVHDGVFWAGLQGGRTAEGVGGLGGLVRFDLERREPSALWPGGLAHAAATDMTVADGALWIATAVFGELEVYGDEGLLRHDLETGAWRHVSADSTALPSDLVWALARDGDQLWVSTGAGPARLDLETGVIEAARLAPGLADDSLVTEVVADGSGPDSVDLAVYQLMRDLRFAKGKGFPEAVRKLPDERLLRRFGHDGYWREVAGEVLAHPSLLPHLLRGLRKVHGRRIAARALRVLEAEHPTVRDSVMALLDSVSVREAATLARGLHREGHAAGAAWVAANLDPAKPRARVQAGLRAARSMQAPRLADELVALSTRRDYRQAAFEALARVAEEAPEQVERLLAEHPGAWRSLLDGSKRLHLLGRHLENAERSYLRLMLHMARRAAESGDADLRLQGARARERLGDVGAVPAYVDLLAAGDSAVVNQAAAALVEATAVDSAPPLPGGDPGARRDLQQFWRRWWEAHREGFEFAPDSAGRRAMRRWRAGGTEP